MLERFYCGWFINTFLLLHLLFIDKSRLPLKLPGILILAIPYLGTVFYLIIYMWNIPPPIPKSYQSQLPETMVFKNITEPDRDLEENEHSGHDRTSGEYAYSSEHVPAGEDNTRNGRSSLWIRVSMFVMGVGFWAIGIQWLKMWLFHPLFLFGGAFLIYLAIVRWNRF